MLNPGQSQIVLSNAGSGTPYLRFASGTPHTTGATVGFSTSGGRSSSLPIRRRMTNGILPYAFYGPVNSTTVDFATLSTSAGMTLVSALPTPARRGQYRHDGFQRLAERGSHRHPSSLTFADTLQLLEARRAGYWSMTGTGSLTLIPAA